MGQQVHDIVVLVAREDGFGLCVDSDDQVANVLLLQGSHPCGIRVKYLDCQGGRSYSQYCSKEDNQGVHRISI